MSSLASVKHPYLRTMLGGLYVVRPAVCMSSNGFERSSTLEQCVSNDFDLLLSVRVVISGVSTHTRHAPCARPSRSRSRGPRRELRSRGWYSVASSCRFRGLLQPKTNPIYPDKQEITERSC